MERKGLSKNIGICIKTVAIIAGCIIIYLGAPRGIKVVMSNIKKSPKSGIYSPTDSVALDIMDMPTEYDPTETSDDLIEHKTLDEPIAEKTPAVPKEQQAKDAISDQPAKTPSTADGKLLLSYGTYTGSIKKGYPNGIGKLVYKTTRQINKYDPKSRMAQPGDYVEGEFVNGFFTTGKHYNADGELIESIFVGVEDDVYEAK